MAKLTKLHRSKNYSMIAGVMGGIAEYLGWSPNLLRFVVVAVIVLSGGVSFFGFAPVYFLLMLLMPRATEASYDDFLDRRTVN